MITESCAKGEVGALRNCGLKNTKATISCTPGQVSKISCSIGKSAKPQFVRVCQYSNKHKSGIACTYEHSIVSGNIESSSTLSFTCPVALGADEPGGKVSLYSGAVATTDELSQVICRKM